MNNLVVKSVNHSYLDKKTLMIFSFGTHRW